MTKPEAEWQTYEQVAAHVLNQCSDQFGLARFDGKQKVQGVATEWEVDARGWNEEGTKFFVVECKKHEKAAVSQALVGSLAYSIKDTGAAGGFIVSPLGIQKGAKGIASIENIIPIRLDVTSTAAKYFGEWLGKLVYGFSENADIKFTEHLNIFYIEADGTRTTLLDKEVD